MITQLEHAMCLAKSGVVVNSNRLHELVHKLTSFAEELKHMYIKVTQNLPSALQDAVRSALKQQQDAAASHMEVMASQYSKLHHDISKRMEAAWQTDTRQRQELFDNLGTTFSEDVSAQLEVRTQQTIVVETI
jgi:gas vesicle protein